MKVKDYLFIVIALVSFDLSGQSFEIPIHFEDAAGYRDTIIIGYDPLASYGIDTSFGEINIIDSAYNLDFEVRAAIYDYLEWPTLPRIIESKKMIIGHVCYDSTYFDEANSIMVVIKSTNWPITMTWDKSNFQEPCNYIDIIDCTPGGWFDVCGGGHPYLLLEMRLTDTASYYSTEFKIETAEDTLSALFLRFFNDFESAIDNPTKKNITFFPNPTNGLIHLDTELHPDDKISITDITGVAISFVYYDQKIDVSSSPDGMYFLTVKFHTGESDLIKIIKNSN